MSIRAADGEILWQKDFGSPLSAPPAPAGDRVYLPLKDGRVVALSLQTGDEIWTHKLAESAAGILPVGDRVFVGARDNQFHSLSAEDADADWRWPTGADLLGLPVLDAKRVYFIALDNVLRGHNRNNGIDDVETGASREAVHRTVVERRDADRVWRRGRAVRAITHAMESLPGTFALKGAENEEMLLAAPPHLTAQDLLILVTKGGQVRAVGSSGAADAEAPAAPNAPPADAPDPGNVDRDSSSLLHREHWLQWRARFAASI